MQRTGRHLNLFSALAIIYGGIATGSGIYHAALAQPESVAGDTTDSAQASSNTSELRPVSIVDKALSAYGGAEAAAALGRGTAVVGKEYEAESLKGQTASDLDGSNADGNFRVLRKGALWRLDHEKSAGLSEGFDGNGAWVKSGATTEDLAADTASLLNWQTMSPATVLLETKRAIEEGGQEVAVTCAGKVDYNGSSVYRIDVKSIGQGNANNSSNAFSLYIEPSSFQVTAMEFTLAGGSKKVNLEYSQYKPAMSTVYPFRILRKVNGRADHLLIATDASLSTASAKGDFDRPGGSFKLSRPVVLPFDYSQRELLVKGRINNGEELDFLFDTGASETIIDRRVAAENFLLKEGMASLTALSGAVSLNTTTIGRLELGNLVVNDLDSRILDLSGQSRNLGRRLAGIIGTNVISRYVVAIDYGKTQITFYDADSYVRPQDLVILPFTKRSAPVVKIKIGGKEEVQMLVDTGAAFNNLPASVALRYVGQGASMRMTEGTGLDGKAVKLGRLSLDNVSIGGRPLRKTDFTYTLQEPPPKVGGGGAGKPGEAQSQGFFQTTNLGIVGNPMLENFLVFVDYKFQRLLLKPSAVVKLRSDIENAISTGDDQLIQKRDFRLSEAAYQKALLAASSGGDKRNEARVLGRLGNLRRMMAKDLNRPEHSKAAYDYFVRAQNLSKTLGAPEIEGRILADWSLLYLDNGQVENAKQTMDRALFLAPQDAGVNVDCSVHLFKSQRFPEMQRYIEKALFLEPSNWQALWYQVKLSETFGDTLKATSTLKEILHYYPWSKLAQEKLKGIESPPKPQAVAPTNGDTSTTSSSSSSSSSTNRRAPLNFGPGQAQSGSVAPTNRASNKFLQQGGRRTFIYGPNTTPGQVPFKR